MEALSSGMACVSCCSAFCVLTLALPSEASEVIQRAESLWEGSPKSKVEFWLRGSAGWTRTQLIIPDNSSLEPELQGGKKAFFSTFALDALGPTHGEDP